MAQHDMTEGYTYLDSRQYPEAIKYFSDVLLQSPENKTAQICLGRALGLSGSEIKALGIFNDLIALYPEDIEVMLNLGEAHMWTKNYDNALKVYGDIILKDSLNFTALLGRSNALTSLNRHREAKESIDRCAALFPDNPQVLISKKYIYLGRSNELRNLSDYAAAHEYVDQVLALFPGDKDALFLKAGIYLFEQKAYQARKTYDLLNKLYPGQTDILSGLSYTNLLVNHNKAYLNYALKALDVNQDKNPATDLSLHLNVVRALFLNNKKPETEQRLNDLSVMYGDSLEFRLIFPQLSLWDQKFDQSRSQYQEILKTDSANYNVLVGNAEILNVFKERAKSLALVNKAYALQPDNPDIRRMQQSLSRYRAPVLSISAQHSYDGGDNVADQYNATVQMVLSERSLSYFQVIIRETKNTFFDNAGSNASVTAGHEWFLHPKLSLLASGGVTRLKNASENIEVNHLIYSGGLKASPFRYHNTELSYDLSFFDYNPDLIRESIQSNNYKLIYHFYGPQRIGFYNQLIRSVQSDDNTRWLYFGSLYYNIFMYPVLQAGFNINRFGYSIQKPELYFSPSRFGSNEVFVKVDSEIVKGTKWRYFGLAAFGWQSIESNPNQSTLRLEGKVSYALSDRLNLGLNYVYSNAAQSTIAGFTYNQAGLAMTYVF